MLANVKYENVAGMVEIVFESMRYLFRKAKKTFLRLFIFLFRQMQTVLLLISSRLHSYVRLTTSCENLFSMRYFELYFTTMVVDFKIHFKKSCQSLLNKATNFNFFDFS